MKLIYCLLLLCLMVAEDEGEFNYDEKSERGPSRWGEIRPEWSMCGHGTMQSPIDLLNKRVEVVSHLGRLKRSYKLAYATLKNRGHDMMVRKMRILNTTFQFQQLAKAYEKSM